MLVLVAWDLHHQLLVQALTMAVAVVVLQLLFVDFQEFLVLAVLVVVVLVLVVLEQQARQILAVVVAVPNGLVVWVTVPMVVLALLLLLFQILFLRQPCRV
jgi:hypothetical protein